MARRQLALSGLILLAASAGHASPNVPLDDPRYDELDAMYARGIVRPHLGGFRPITEQRMDALIGGGGEPRSDWWITPFTRVRLGFVVARDLERPYSTPARPHDLVGLLATSCEHAEGRPCGPGAGLVAELDTSVGYADSFSLSTRLRADLGTNSYAAGVGLERAYMNARLGPFAAELGRDVIALGPSARTALGWGDHAPPLDHVRLSTAEPFELTSSVRINLVYILGRLRDPQAFPDNLVSIGRGQLDLGDDVEVGVMQLLQLGGEGAPSFDLEDFIAEHFRRGDASATESDTSNRRVGLDIAIRSASFAGARFYYALMFEDWRDRFHDALRHDADHLLGVDLAAVGPGRRHRVVVELHQTGIRSQEHAPRVTGFTNAGRVTGSPLGPGARSIYGSGRIALGKLTIEPWLDVARLSSDTYTFAESGRIEHTTHGPSEMRYRVGARVRRTVLREITVELDGWFEHIERLGFVPGVRRDNAGVSASLIWRPDLTFP